MHRAFNTLGLLLATAGIIIAWSQFEALDDSDLHKRLGFAVMILGWLQPLNALVRPHAAKKGEGPTALRLVWSILHTSIGYITLALAIAEVFIGLKRARTFNLVKTNRWRNTYVATIITISVLSVLGFAHRLWRQNHEKKTEEAASSENFPAILDAPVPADVV
jgi:cytochrome b561